MPMLGSEKFPPCPSQNRPTRHKFPLGAWALMPNDVDALARKAVSLTRYGG